MAALLHVPRAFLNQVWDQAAASDILSSLRGAASNLTVAIDNSTNVATEVPARLAASDRVAKGFFDPSNVYTSGYALGVAIMVRPISTLLITLMFS